MILLDTNILVALLDKRDGLHAKARADLRALKRPFGAIDAVLVECFALVRDPALRRRLWVLLSQLGVQPVSFDDGWWDRIQHWMTKYQDHHPDLCDALLIEAAVQKHAKIWTYDREFSEIWRTRDGQKLKLAR